MANTLRKLAAPCRNDKRPDCPILDDLAEAELPTHLDDVAKKGKPAAGRLLVAAGPSQRRNGGSILSPAMRTGRTI